MGCICQVSRPEYGNKNFFREETNDEEEDTKEKNQNQNQNNHNYIFNKIQNNKIENTIYNNQLYISPRNKENNDIKKEEKNENKIKNEKEENLKEKVIQKNLEEDEKIENDNEEKEIIETNTKNRSQNSKEEDNLNLNTTEDEKIDNTKIYSNYKININDEYYSEKNNNITIIEEDENEYENNNKNNDFSFFFDKNDTILKKNLSEIEKKNNNDVKNEITNGRKSIKSDKLIYTIKKKYDYNETVFQIINKIREDPKSYISEIENNIKYIKEETKITKNSKGEEKEKKKIIFKKRIKVALTKGEAAFRETINILQKMNPVKPLIFSNNILIKLPETKEEMKDRNFLINEAKKVQENYNLEIYFKDFVKDPFISVLLMIVDDNVKNAGKKRNCILNPDFKYIGINSKFIGKHFIAFFSFSK